MAYRLFTLNEKKLWLEYFKSLPIDQQDVFFTPDYYSLYQNYGDGEATCFVYEEEDRIVLYPFLKNSINSLGYGLSEECYDIQGAYGYNGVVTSCKDADFLSRFHGCFDKYCSDNNIIAEFSRFHPLLKNEKLASSKMSIIFDRKVVYVDLSDDYETIFNSFGKTTKKELLKSKSKYDLDIKIFEHRTDNDLDLFCEIYKETMDRVESEPYLYFNREYFEGLLNMDDTLFIVVYSEGKPIAVEITLKSPYYIYGHIGGRLTEYLRTPANSLFEAERIKYGIEHGCKYSYLGGGTTSDPEDPLLRFKSHFSRDLSDFYIGKRVHNMAIYQQIVEQWKKGYPDLYEKNKVKLLGYRDI